MDDAKATASIKLQYAAFWKDDEIDALNDINIGNSWFPQVQVMEATAAYDGVHLSTCPQMPATHSFAEQSSMRTQFSLWT